MVASCRAPTSVTIKKSSLSVRSDSLAERSEFELPVPVSKLSDDTIMLGFIDDHRGVMTMAASRQLRLGAFMRPVSIHTAWWRYPGASPDANFNFEHLKRFA